MDSINKNQEEKNQEHLANAEAWNKIRELIEKNKTCFFCTGTSLGQSEGVRPMSVLQIDDEGSLWFLSAKDSHKNKEILINHAVRLYFQGSPHSDFLYLDGMASISPNNSKVKELWNPILKTWFTEGENDYRITVIKVTPTTGYYWDTKHGNTVALLKTMVGAMTGKTMDDSIEGSLVTHAGL